MLRIYVVKTPTGYLGKRSHSYTSGSNASRDAKFKASRLFTREGDCRFWMKDGDEIVFFDVEEQDLKKLVHEKHGN